MPALNIYFSEKEIEHIKDQPSGYVRKLVQRDINPRGEGPDTAQLEKKVVRESANICKKCGYLLPFYKAKCKNCGNK